MGQMIGKPVDLPDPVAQVYGGGHGETPVSIVVISPWRNSSVRPAG
jgi:hypothetical protein